MLSTKTLEMDNDRVKMIYKLIVKSLMEFLLRTSAWV
jgi:hypothetical protein